MDKIKFYIFSGLASPHYKTKICLAGPFSSTEEALACVKQSSWQNWIIEGQTKAFVVGQTTELPVAFDTKNDFPTSL